MGDSRCKTCALGWSELRRVNADLLSGSTIEAVSTKFGLSPSSLKRHRLSHLDRSIRQPDRVDEERSAADLLVGMADRLADLGRLANAAMQRGQSLAAVRATTEARQLGKLIFTDLGPDSTVTAPWLRDLDGLWKGVQAWAREQPAVLTVLAEHVEKHDIRLARELRAGHDLLTTAKALKTEKEDTAA